MANVLERLREENTAARREIRKWIKATERLHTEVDRLRAFERAHTPQLDALGRENARLTKELAALSPETGSPDRRVLGGDGGSSASSPEAARLFQPDHFDTTEVRETLIAFHGRPLPQLPCDRMPEDSCYRELLQWMANLATWRLDGLLKFLTRPPNPPNDCPCGCLGDWFRHGVGDPFG